MNTDPVVHLSVDQAEHLLVETGIPVEEVKRYRTTIVGGNVDFWDQLITLDRNGLLTRSGGRIIKKRHRRLAPVG